MGNFRWLSVGVPGQEDVAITLMAIPGPPVFDEDTRRKITDLMAKGASGGLFFATDDVQGTYQELQEARRRVPAGADRAALRRRRRLPRPVGQLDADGPARVTQPPRVNAVGDLELTDPAAMRALAEPTRLALFDRVRRRARDGAGAGRVPGRTSLRDPRSPVRARERRPRLTTRRGVACRREGVRLRDPGTTRRDRRPGES